MKKILTTASLATAGLAAAALVGWQAPAAFADHGADDGAPSSSVTQRHGNDDGPRHDANDDHGRHGHHGHGHHGHGNDD